MPELATGFIGVVFVVVAGSWLARRRRIVPAAAVAILGLLAVIWAIWRGV